MEELDGNGVIESKEERATKKGNPYWKFVIDGKKYNFFDYESGEKVKSGQRVRMYWKEEEGNYNGKPIIYRNLTSIFDFNDARADMTDEELAKEEDEVNKATGVTTTSANVTMKKQENICPPPENGARNGMLFNNAIALCISEKKTKLADVEKMYKELKRLYKKIEI